MQKFREIFKEKAVQEIYEINDGKEFLMPLIPSPKAETGYPFPACDGYDVTSEPKFDPKIHLANANPKNVAIMQDEKYVKVPFGYKCKPNKNGSEFMYSEAFQLFSEEGTKVAHEILTNLKRSAKSNGRSTCVRGIFYMSPWFRDLTSSDAFSDHMSAICGEKVHTHMYLQNTQMNVGKVGLKGPVDQWHFDSVQYVCVSILSDIEGMIGGDLELVKHPKEKAINLILNGDYEPEDLVKVSYEKTGCAILCQGSRIIHHVTGVEKAKEDRMSLIISCTPANVYHPESTVLNSMQKLDMNYAKGVPEFEFFRQKSWQMSHILKDYTENEKFALSDAGAYYAKKLRAVAAEITRTADLLDGTIEDKIGFFAEKGDKGSPWLNEKSE